MYLDLRPVFIIFTVEPHSMNFDFLSAYTRTSFSSNTALVISKVNGTK